MLFKIKLVRRIVFTGVFKMLLLQTVLLSQANFWSQTTENGFRTLEDKRVIVPSSYLLFSFDFERFNSLVSTGQRGITELPDFQVPMPDGSFKNFELKETPVFEEGFSELYPGFYSFTGYENGNTGTVLKLSLSPFNVNLMITGPGMQPVFIDPFTPYNSTTYIVYYKTSLKPRKGGFVCDVQSSEKLFLSEEEKVSFKSASAGDCQLRTYRLALACTGEYSAFHGGTREKVLAAYNTTMTRVNGIYERDVAITMKLIKDTDKLIFLDPETDPYTNSNGSAMLNQNQTTIDNIIGIQNYDIGHVFSTGGGGIANLRAPCSNNRAKGVTGQEAPVGDPFDVDYVAHEMGHQFGANHTQNNSCQRNNSTAVEPGSASTIMGYAGICDPNVQSNSDAHFHAVSVAEITAFTVNGNGNGCAVRTEINNRPPEMVNASATYTVPVSTSFLLQAEAIDSDGDSLTYCWEQINNQVATMPPVATNTAGPSFRSLPPSPNPVRYFPDLERRHPLWEVLPSVARAMSFRCTVRDNYYGGGCTDESNVEVNFTDQAGPFVLTYPNTPAVSWLVGSRQTVLWNVAKTDLAPVNCARVDLFLSTDGGKSYPVLIAKDVPNTGSAEIETPGFPSSMARVMVKASDNIFFDVSNANFKIISSFSIASDSENLNICNEDSLTIHLFLTKNLEFSDPIQLELTDTPQQISAFFEKDVISEFPDTIILKLKQLQSLNSGDHTVEIQASSGNEKLKLTINLFKASTDLQLVRKIFPEINQTGVDPYKVPFRWSKVSGVQGYRFQLSNRPDFQNMLKDVIVRDTFSIENLAEGSIYFWRIQAVSPCQDNPFTELSVFRTAGGSNQQSVILKNEVLLTDKQSIAVIDDKKLKIETINSAFAYFTLVGKPVNGTLLLGNDTIKVGDNFSMKNVEEGLLKYLHGENTADRDSFLFDVLDDQNRWLPGNVFAIRIRQGFLGVVAFRLEGLSCFGDQTAVVSGEGFGGISPYQYALNGGAYRDSSIFENLKAGSYRIFIKDAVGDVDSSNLIVVKDPDQLILSLKLQKYDIVAEGEGGTGLLQYAIQDSSFSEDNIFEDPGNGYYTITVKDDNGCIVSDTLSVLIPALLFETSVNSQILCAGQKAAVKLKASGGLPPYVYSLDGMSFSAAEALNLSAGKYVFTAKDSGDKIVVSDSVIITQPLPITVTVTQNKFQVILKASGGTGKLTYSQNGIDYTDQDTFYFSDNGTYRLYVRDENNCLRTINVNLNVLKDVTVNIKNAACYGKNDGSINIIPQNGNPPFQYRLGTGSFSTVNSWSGLPAGEYSFSIVDSKKDTLAGGAVVSQPDSLQAEVDFITTNNIQVKASGGTPGYMFSIDGGLTFTDKDMFSDLVPGIYKIVVRDKNGCHVSFEIAIVSTKDYPSESNWMVTPNPVSDYMLIYANGAVASPENVTVQIYNASGVVWQQINIESMVSVPHRFNTHDWPAGIYTIHIYELKSHAVYRVVKL